MILIGENLHILSQPIRSALLSRDEKFISDLIKKMAHMDYIDLNVGPAKLAMENVLPWLCSIVEKNSDLKISFDTTNSEEMYRGLQTSKKSSEAIINSTSADASRLEQMTDLAQKFGSYLVALTLNDKIGIPKTADGRLELAFEIYETCLEKEISNHRIFFDPLILPVSVDQAQAIESLNTIKMLKESFEPSVMTTIGLSNISNGSPKEFRPLINKVFLALAFGCGLDSCIIDALDENLLFTIKLLNSNSPRSLSEKLLIDLSKMMRDFSDIEDVKFDKNDEESLKLYKTAKILLNKEVYSHSFIQV